MDAISSASQARTPRHALAWALLCVAGVAAFLALLRPFGPLAMSPAGIHLAAGVVVLTQTRGRAWKGAALGAASSMAGGIFFHLASSHIDFHRGFFILATTGTLGLWIGAAAHALTLRYLRLGIASLLGLAAWLALAAQLVPAAH